MVLKINKSIILGATLWIIAILCWIVFMFSNEINILFAFVLAITFFITFASGFIFLLKGFD